MNPVSNLVRAIRECRSCAERRQKMREAAETLRQQLGLRSTLEARRRLNEQMHKEPRE